MNDYAIDLYNEGLKYYNGSNGYPLNYNKAYECFMKSADMGCSLAMNNIGVLYQEGKAVPQNYSTAVDWFFKAAQTKPVALLSWYNLGNAYYNGQGVKKDITTAKEMLGRAIAEGDGKSDPHADCCFLMGIIYLEYDKEYQKAMACFSEAALVGKIPAAYHNIGMMYEQRYIVLSDNVSTKSQLDVEQDRRARLAYEDAAELGYAPSMDALGRMWLKYNRKDEARKWLEKGAKLGYKPAQDRLRLVNSIEYGTLGEQVGALMGLINTSEKGSSTDGQGGSILDSIKTTVSNSFGEKGASVLNFLSKFK